MAKHCWQAATVRLSALVPIAALIATAKADGFHLMRLDTGNLLKEAIAMYQSIGFRECPAYHDYPAKLMPYLVFMEMPLKGNPVA